MAHLCRGRRSVAGAQAVRNLQILSVGSQGPRLQTPVTVCGRVVNMVVDTGSPVTVLPHCYVHDADLQQCSDVLQAYGGSQLQVLGTCIVPLVYKGQAHDVKVYVVPHGSPIMGLDAMQLFGVNIVNNSVCLMSQADPGTPAPATPADPAGGPAPIIGFEHRVTVNPEIPPVRQPPRRLPWAIRDQEMEVNNSEVSADDKSTSKLESMLQELVSYKHVGDMSDMSPEVQALLRREEETQAREEARRATRRLKGRRPRERRRRKESDPSVAGCTHAGGSLDNLAAESCGSPAAGKQKGVAGRTAEGGSCFNLSRGSFEPALRRARQQQGGSLEDLGAIDESAAGGRGAGLEPAARSGGSLQHLCPPPAAGADGGEAAAAVQPPPPSPSDAGRPVVIQMAEEDSDESGDETAARRAVRALAAPCPREEPPGRGTDLQERPRHTLSLEEGGGALMAAAAGGSRKTTDGDTELRQVKGPKPAPAADRSSVVRGLSLGQTCTVEEFNVSRAVRMAARKAQTLDGGGGGGSTAATGSRHENGRHRKRKPKVEATVMTESVEGHQGTKNVDDLIQFIESGDSKLTAAAEKSGRKAERATRRDVKGRRSGEERPGRPDRRAARRPAAKPAAPAPAPDTSPARSASLEARPAVGGGAAEHSRLCGDLAQSRAAPAPALWERDGVAYVSAAPATVEDEFVRDFYSAAGEAGAPEESEFHVVTRRQRRRASARNSAGQESVAAAAGSRPASGADPSWRPSRAAAAGRAAAARSVTTSEETSDTDSDGTASAPAAARAALPADSGVASSASNSSASSASSASSTSLAFSASSSAAASWADVAKPKPADIAAQTDFIDGVGAIFGDRSPARAGRPAGFVGRAFEPENARIAGAHPDEFPAIPSPAPAAMVSVLQSPAVSAAPVSTEQGSVVTDAESSGSPAAAAAAAVAKRSQRAPAVEIPISALPGDAADCGDRSRLSNIQFGYIDTGEMASPPAVGTPGPETAPSGVDGFCRRFRPQPVDVSQFNWREVSVFLAKVYAEAVMVPGAVLEVQCAQRR